MLGFRSKSTRGSRAASPDTAAKGRAAQVLGTIALVAIIAALIAGLTVGFDPLEARARRILSGSKPVSVTVEWPALAGATTTGTAPATWIPEQLREKLMDTATRALGIAADPYSRRALELVGEAARDSGWFENTPTVTRRAGGEIHVAGLWRTPAAVVQQNGKLTLVSWTGKPMPVEYDLDARLGSLAIITGVTTPLPRTPTGQIAYTRDWKAPDAEAALELLALVSKQPWRDQIRAVNTSNFSRTKQLEIETIRGGRVVWGGRPSAPLPGETSTREKLDKIAWLQRQYKSIDAGRDAIEVFGQRPMEINISASVAGAGTGGP